MFARWRRARLALGGGLVRRIVSASLRSPRRALGVWTAFLLLSLAAGSRIQFDTSISGLLDSKSEGWSLYQESLERHGGDEFVAVVFQSREPFDPETLAAVRRVGSELEAIDGVARVDSLASVALIRPGLDGSVNLDGAIEDGVPQDPARLAALRGAIARDLIAPGALLSRDERAIAMNVVLDEDVLGDRNRIVRNIEEVAGTDALVSGVPVFRTKVNSDTQRESLIFTPLTVGVMAILLSVAFGSLFAASLPLAVGGIGTIAAIGALGATGTPLSLSTMILPSILLALGSAYSMHMVTAAGGIDSQGELEAQLRHVSLPVALSGLTTTLGFLGISITDLASIRELSFFGAYGVLVVTAASVSFLPAVLGLRRAPLVETPTLGWLRGPFGRGIASFSLLHPRGILLGWVAVSIVGALGLQQLSVSSDVIRWYALDAPIRAEYRAIREAISGISPVSIYVEATGERGVTEPDVVAALDRLSDELEARPDVGKVLGLGHPLRSMRAAVGGGSADLPRTRAEAEQYLLLLESEDPVWDVVSRDRRTARLAMRVDDNRSDAIVELVAWAEGWWTDNGPDDFRARGTGIMLEFARSNESMVETQIGGLLLALVGVGFVLWVVVGRFATAALCLLPNLLPILVAYGAMGWVGVPLDAATACLGSLALGIAVDDTVHVVSSWTRERARGRSARGAVLLAIPSVVPALVLSSLAIACGFAVLGLSELMLIRNLGIVTAAVVAVCWAADLSLLPVLLVGSEREPEDAGTR